ncbi:MAG TPA: hypothetical protein VGZ48_08265 [Candidatus Acidoferrales bacterium]|jgi:hypothetical protein|nr:hypothetical protein [Candidatus Acidoferrales bacterium]
MKRLLFSLLIFTFAGIPLIDAPKSPFSISIVPTRSDGNVGEITLANKMSRDFYVVLTNKSQNTQSVWEVSNSWGYQAISFELTSSEGKTYVVSKKLEDFTMNAPSTFLVEAGEHQVFAIRLDKDWETRPVLPKRDEMPITLKAVYEATQSPEASQYKVWTGRVESHSYNITLRQW